MSNPADVPFSTTILVRDTCLCLHAQRAARALARRFDDELKPYGLTNGQFSLLMSLNRPEPPPMGPVAELLAMDQTTLTAALKPLERRGLVERRANPSDRRSRLLALTDAGRRTLAAAVPVWKRVHGEIEAGLSDPEMLRADLRVLSFGPPPPGDGAIEVAPPQARRRGN
ncbi:MarR family winged helix-turn-helix transcriptional regulator [Amorphus sp. MBR-141]